MTVLSIGGIPTSLGEVINYKYHLDLVKNNYRQIRLGFYMPLLQMGLNTNAPDWPHKKRLWEKYLKDIGQLFFSEPPYVLENNSATFCGDIQGLLQKLHMQPTKPYMPELLAKGTPLNIGPYIVITTKARDVSRKNFLPRSIKLWKVLSKLSEKYKIVILGEKLVEMRKEYLVLKNDVFGIYEQIIANIPPDRILDLTVPALGETVADLKEIQQDCLIMRDAQLTISLGIGGNVCLSCASSKMAIGYRIDDHHIANLTYGREYPNAIITKDWNYFIALLERYL
jgi:hypothetical protein